MTMTRSTKCLEQTSIHMYLFNTNDAVEHDDLLDFIKFLIKVQKIEVHSKKKQHKIDKLGFMSSEKNFYNYFFILVGKQSKENTP